MLISVAGDALEDHVWFCGSVAVSMAAPLNTDVNGPCCWRISRPSIAGDWVDIDCHPCYH